MRFGKTDKFWMVTNPRPASVLEDILFETSLADLELIFKGGLSLVDADPAMFTDREEAEREAKGRMLANA